MFIYVQYSHDEGNYIYIGIACTVVHMRSISIYIYIYNYIYYVMQLYSTIGRSIADLTRGDIFIEAQTTLLVVFLKEVLLVKVYKCTVAVLPNWYLYR